MANFKHFDKVKPRYRNRIKMKFPYSFDDVFLEKQLLSNSRKFMNAESDPGSIISYFICALLLFTVLSSISLNLYSLISVDHLDIVGDTLTTVNIDTTSNQVSYYGSKLLPKNLKVFSFLNLLD